ncbi:MAG TPA: hypothetical protein VNA20_00015 [Frankiaceae bacterium]|nr:hypothetical protein [Frankiaceae bacterium]
MEASYPVGKRIVRVAGLLEHEAPHTHAKDFSMVLELDDAAILLVTPRLFARLPAWPDEVDEMPTRLMDDGAPIIGGLITSALMRHRPQVDYPVDDQLFFVIDGTRLVAVLPTAQGSVLHVEPILSSPLLGRRDALTSLDGAALSIDDLVLL